LKQELLHFVRIIFLSPAACGRGLKPAKFMKKLFFSGSPAACGRGLKPDRRSENQSTHQVARRVRAWIETCCTTISGYTANVARRVRAWIETRTPPAIPA